MNIDNTICVRVCDNINCIVWSHFVMGEYNFAYEILVSVG